MEKKEMSEEEMLDYLMPPLVVYNPWSKEFCLTDGSPYLVEWKKAMKRVRSLIRFYRKVSKEDIENFNKKINEQLKQKAKRLEVPKTKVEPICGYIYFLKANDRVVKIGRTIDLTNRFEQIDPQIPFETEIIHIIKTNDYVKMEEMIHKHYENRRTKGEWFDLTKDDLEEISTNAFPQKIKDLIVKEKK